MLLLAKTDKESFEGALAAGTRSGKTFSMSEQKMVRVKADMCIVD